MYKVWFDDLMLFARVGISDAEREVGTRLRIGVEISVEKPPPETDSVDGVVDYAAAVSVVHAAIESGPAKTLEAIAARIADRVFNRFAEAGYVKVEVAKVPPPTVEWVSAAGVTCGFPRP